MYDAIELRRENEALKEASERVRIENEVLKGRIRELEAANRSLAKATGSPASVLKHTAHSKKKESD